MQSESPRRSFLAHCGSLLGLLTLGKNEISLANTSITPFHRCQLVDNNHQPLNLEHLKPNQDYLFHYPYVTTPCFLINLDKPAKAVSDLSTSTGKRYKWSGGIGLNQSLVAFSAICAHRMSHPTRTVSFIGYRSKQTGFYNKSQHYERRGGIIQCCSEQSVYDPAEGGRVLGGPAPQPLAAIALETDSEQNIYAVGVTGGMMFDQYFERFGKRLLIEYERMDIDSPVGDQSRVITMQDYTGRTMECG